MKDLHPISGCRPWLARPHPGLTAYQPPRLRTFDAGSVSLLIVKERTVYGAEQPICSRAGPLRGAYRVRRAQDPSKSRPAAGYRGRDKGPPGQAHHLITTCGVLGSVAAGIAGAVLTLRASPDLRAPAFAELALAVTSAALIARRAPWAAGAAGA